MTIFEQNKVIKYTFLHFFPPGNELTEYNQILLAGNYQLLSVESHQQVIKLHTWLVILSNLCSKICIATVYPADAPWVMSFLFVNTRNKQKKRKIFTVVIYSWEELLEEQQRGGLTSCLLTHLHRRWWMILCGGCGASSLHGRLASVRAVRRGVIMFLLRPGERKGDRRGCADAAAERPNCWPPLHFWSSRSWFESGDNDDSSVLTGMWPLLKPEGPAASAVGLCAYSAGPAVVYLFLMARVMC